MELKCIFFFPLTARTGYSLEIRKQEKSFSLCYYKHGRITPVIQLVEYVLIDQTQLTILQPSQSDTVLCLISILRIDFILKKKKKKKMQRARQGERAFEKMEKIVCPNYLFMITLE